MLCRNEYAIVQKLRSQVGAVGPTQCAKLRMNSEVLENGRILEGLKYLPVEFLAQVDIAFGSI